MCTRRARRVAAGRFRGQYDPVAGPLSMTDQQRRANSQSRSQSVYTINSGRNLVGIKSKKSFYKKFRKKDILIYILATIVAFLAVAIVVISIFYAKFTRDSMDLCDNEDCLRIAASLKETMNTSIDPCDDFYKFTCGRWPESHTPFDLSQEHNWFKEKNVQVSRRIRDLLMKNLTGNDIPWSVQEAKVLFLSCMDVESLDELGLEPLFDLLDALGLPRIPPALTKHTSDFVTQLANIKRILWADIFFGVYVTADPKDTKKSILVFDLPDRQNPFPSDKILEKRLKVIKARAREVSSDEPDEEVKNVTSTEKIYMSEVMKQLISNGTTDQPTCKSRGPFLLVPEAEISEVVDNVFNMEKVLYEITHNFENDTYDDDEDIEDDNYMSLDDLQNITDAFVKSINETLEPKVIWQPFIQELLNGVVDFDPALKVLVLDLDYLKEVAVILSQTDNELLETVIWWTVVDYCVPYSSKELRRIWHTYVSDLTGYSDRSWSIYCAENVNDLMGMAVAWLFVNPLFLEDGSSDKVYEMLMNIKASFSDFVSSIDWMDEKTKLATLEKNRKMKSLIGYPDWLFEEDELDAYYEGINMSDTTYFDNMLQIIRLENDNILYDLTNRSDDEPIWPVDPTEVNAMHTFQENQIAIPSGILQFPFYGLGLEALNYGAIGTILGHELTHGFDNSGRRFDSEGNFKQWWSNDTVSRYTNKTSCFVEQYDNYYIPEIDEHINGKLTLGENIADNGGLRQAYHAYQIWKSDHGEESTLPGFSNYTHDQLLFLGYAHMWCESYSKFALRWMIRDPHCPGHVRLKMVLRNSEHFSKVWNCPEGSNMNPEKKCQVW